MARPRHRAWANSLALCLLAVALLSRQPAAAAPQRIRVEAMEYPWSAIGRLNSGGRSWCTAVLVGERHILTAAHCLWNRATQDWWRPAALHFIAGYQGGEALLPSGIAGYVIADHYGGAPPPGLSHAATDWALLELSDPVGRRAGWLAVGAPTAAGAGRRIAQVGYRAESPHAMTLDYGCQPVAGVDPGHLLWDDCAAAHGDSGGPLLDFGAGGPQVIGLTVLSVTGPGKSLTGAVALSVLTDIRDFPIAATAATAAGIGAGKAAGQPPAGGVVSVTPDKTIATLSPGAIGGANLAALAGLLNR